MSDIIIEKPRERLNRDGRRRLVVVFGYVLFIGLVLFVSAGTLRWPAAWAYLLLYLGCILTAGLYVAYKRPAIVNERGRRSEATKPFDKIFTALAIPLTVAALVVAGMDFRFDASAMPLWLQIAGFALLLPGLLMPYWVMWVNAYAATTVRVETERGQRVITDGPYRYVRHPMYSTVVLGNLAIPLALGSWWMYVPTLLTAALFIWRTAREDATLLAELPGYTEYAGRTRYRLLPGVW